MKTCSRCRQQKPLEQFSKDGTKKDGCGSRCLVCSRERCRDYRKTASGVASRLKRQRTHAGPIAARSRAWWAARPERRRKAARANAAVWRAIKSGRLSRPDRCEQCDKPAKVHAAHADYNRPLDVRWLCPCCHASWDHAEPKTA